MYTIPTLPLLPRQVTPTLLEGRMVLTTLDRSRIVLDTTIPRPDAPPVNTVAPVVAPDDPYVGSLCTCSTGTWTGATPITYTYQWYEFDGSNSFILTGETASVYTATIANVGNQLYCIVTATNSDGSASATSNYTVANVLVPEAPVNVVPPVISGTVAVGQTLTLTSVGTWTGLPAPTYLYQWRVDDAFIAGEVGTTIVVQAGTENGVYDCIVTGVNIAGSDAAESNDLSGGAPPINLTAPVISGTVSVGSTLSTTDGTWDNVPTSYTYQWTRDGSPIGSATSNTYAVVGADMAADIQCEVTAINGAGSDMAASNTLASVWKAALLEVQSYNGYMFVHGEGISETVGNPVEDWYDLTGTVRWLQSGASSIRPVRESNGLDFDGTDDFMDADGFDSLMAGANWTMGIGANDAATTSVSVHWGISDGLGTANLINVVNNSNRLGVFNSPSSANLFTAANRTGTMSVWFTRNGGTFVRRLESAESTQATAVSPVGLNTLTLCARKTPTPSIFASERVAWVVIADQTMSSASMAAIEAVLTTNGYPVV